MSTPWHSLAALVLLGLAAIAAPALAAEEKLPAKDVAFSFEGPFGTFDRAQLQRGYKVYKEVCSTCHSMTLLRFRNLGEPGGPEFPPEQVKAMAAEYKVTDGPDASGNMFERPALPSDPFPSRFPMTLRHAPPMAGRCRPTCRSSPRCGPAGPAPVTLYTTQLINGMGGPEYVYSVLTGYEDPPKELAAEAPEGKFYNPYFENGHWIGMPPPLSDGAVTYDDGTKATVDQMARDVSAFLAWAGEPKMEERKHLGFLVMIYLALFAVLLYLVKRRIWGRHE